MVFRVGGIGQDLQQLLVAPDTTAVVRRGGASAAEAHGMELGGVGPDDLLDKDAVLP